MCFRHGLLLPQSSRMSAAAAAAANGSLVSGSSVFRETPLAQGEVSNNLRDELKRMKRRRQLASQNVAAQIAASSSSSNCSSINSTDGLHQRPSSSIGCASAPSSPEPMNQEIGNMSPQSASTTQLSRASISNSRGNSSSQISLSSASGSSHASSSVQCNSSNVPSTSNRNIKALMGTGDKPVFTLKQMTLICERMCKVRYVAHKISFLLH